MNAKSQVAVITGASRGQGAAMAQALLDEGWLVEGWDLKAETDLKHENFFLRSVNVTSWLQASRRSLPRSKGGRESGVSPHRHDFVENRRF